MIRHAILTILRDWEKHAIPFDERSLWVMVALVVRGPDIIDVINREWKRDERETNRVPHA